MIHNAVRWLTLCGLVLLPRCATSPVSGSGGSSETVNAKLLITDTSVILAADDNDAELTMRIYSTDYRPYEKRGLADSVASVTVNDPGWNAPASGSYNILLAAAVNKNVSCLIRNVSFEHGVRDTIQCVLKAHRNLSGSIVAPDNSTVAEPFVVAIYGTPFVALSDTTGRFSINAVPPESYSINVRSTAKRLFVPSSTYSISSEMFNESTIVRMILP